MDLEAKLIIGNRFLRPRERRNWKFRHPGRRRRLLSARGIDKQGKVEEISWIDVAEHAS